MLAVIWSLAWPTMLEQLMQTAVQYIDTAMVGVLGTSATAAVGATSTVNWLVNSSISALSIGFLSYIARARGAGDERAVKRAVMQVVLTTLLVGSVFTALTVGLSSLVPVWMQVDPALQSLAARYFLIIYLPMLPRTASLMFGTVLRAVGDTKMPMKIGVGMNITNVVLNFLLIYDSRTVTVFGQEVLVFGAGMGVLGAATASAVAFAVGGIAITVVLLRHKIASPLGERFRFDGEVMRPCLRVALPNMLQRFGTSFGYVAFASMINALGEVATAAHTIANTVESAFYIPGFGMQTAAATLSGNAYGASDRKRMKELSDMFIPLEIALMLVSGGLLFAFAPALMDVFSDSAEVIALGAVVLRMVAVSEPFYGVSIIVEGMLQGVGRTRESFRYNILGMWGVRIVGTYICTTKLGFGLVSAWACMIGHNMLVFVLFLRCFISGRWNPLNRTET